MDVNAIFGHVRYETAGIILNSSYILINGQIYPIMRVEGDFISC